MHSHLHDVLGQQENGTPKFPRNTDYVGSIQLLFFIYHFNCEKTKSYNLKLGSLLHFCI